VGDRVERKTWDRGEHHPSGLFFKAFISIVFAPPHPHFRPETGARANERSMHPQQILTHFFYFTNLALRMIESERSHNNDLTHSAKMR